MNELSTERLLLRPLVDADVEALHEFWNDPAVRRYLWDNKPISTEEVRSVVADSQHNFETLGAGYFAVEAASEPGRLIGFCGYRRFEDGTQPELLYGLLPEFWGKGLLPKRQGRCWVSASSTPLSSGGGVHRHAESAGRAGDAAPGHVFSGTA